jgi:hypothetical protein
MARIKSKTRKGERVIYTRNHTNKTAYTRHLAGLKKRGANIISQKGMTITYTFPIRDNKNTSTYEN